MSDVGISSIAGYLPRLRLSKKTVAQANSWIAPNLIGKGKGTRSMANWDEDSVTMSVEAIRRVLGKDDDRSHVDSLFFASTTMPFVDRLNSGIIRAALTLEESTECIDISSTLKSGTTALIQALDKVKSGGSDYSIVSASDKRKARSASSQELDFGDGAVAIAVNELIVSSQWSSLFFAIALTLITLALVFKDIRFSIWTTSPVIATVGMQWLVMWQMDVPLSLVTVMIGSILVGVGVDFSIHIANSIKELGGGIEAIRSATVSTGMSLFEAATVTTLGMISAYQIPIPEIKPFVTVIIILLWISAASALFLLPAIFVTLEQFGVGSVGGASAMAKRLGLVNNQEYKDSDVIATISNDEIIDAW